MADKFNVLIIDDNKHNQVLLSKTMEKLNCRVFIASNGRAGLQTENLEEMDLILLDVSMPEMDGYETCKNLKNNDSTKEIPIIFISALSETENILKGFKAGAVDYISKPFQIEEVIARVNVQLELKQKKNELDHTIDKLIKTQKQLYESKKLASLGTIAAGLAHEINNPVNFVFTGANSLKEDFQDIKPLLELVNKKIESKDKECINLIKLIKRIDLDTIIDSIPHTIDDILHGASRAAEIVRGLKDFSHPDSDIMQPTNINKILDTACVLLRNKLAADTVISKDYDENISDIMAYSGQLNQVFLNIISNAIDAFGDVDIKTKEKNFKKQIIIKTIKNKKDVKIVIKDNGSGIPEDIIDNIFDPFFTTKSIGNGTGLGLSISHGIIKKHKGKIEVDSTLGVGTEFTITLPEYL